MYLKSFHNASRKGAVIVYAMVFSMVAAAALYVGSSVFNARIQGDAISEYGRQRVFLQKTFEHVLFDAMRMSYEDGYGISGPNMWYSYSGTSYSPAAGGYTNEEMARYNPQDAINLFANYINGTKTDQTTWKDSYKWKMKTVGNSEFVDPIRNLYTSSDNLKFKVSEFLTIPGWRPVRDSDTITDSNEDYQDFIAISSSSFPSSLTQRKDLPFNQSRGWARAVRTRYQYALSADERNLTGDDQMDIWSDPIWLVEEPVTNYQLVLLDKQGDGAWPNSRTGTIILKNSGTQGGNVAKMLAVGPIDQGAGEGSFGKQTVGYDKEQAPIAFLLDAGNFKEDNETGLEVRYAHRSAFVGLGDGAAPSSAMSSIVASRIDNTLKDLRQQELWNAHALINPSPIYPGAPSSSLSALNAWVNPVLYVNITGHNADIGWTRQQSSGLVANFGAPMQIHPLLATSPAITLQARDSSAASYTGFTIPGLSTYLWNDGGQKKTIVRIDLSTFDLSSISGLNDSPNNGDGYPWSAPREIQIKGAWGVSILGAPTPNQPINEVPLKIVTDSQVISFKEDANYRRFMLVSVPTAHGSSGTNTVEPAEIYFQPTSSHPVWYGTLFAAQGAKLYSSLYDVVEWYGTIVAAKDFSLADQSFSLKIAPDDGAGLIGSGGFSHLAAQHNRFCPSYESVENLSMGNPVPFRAPSLMWILK